MKYITIILFGLLIVGCGGEVTEDNETVKNEALLNFNFPSDCCSTEFKVTSVEESVNSISRVYLPSVIANVESNSSFYPLAIYVNLIEGMIIRDESDSIVFQLYNFPPNKIGQGWDGKVNGIETDGKYSVELSIQTVEGIYLRAEGVICVLLCETDDYFERDLDLSNCLWPSQHDGNGGFDPNLPIQGLSNCF